MGAGIDRDARAGVELRGDFDHAVRPEFGRVERRAHAVALRIGKGADLGLGPNGGGCRIVPWNHRLRTIPGADEFDGIESGGEEGIGPIEHATFDCAVGENAGKPGMIVGDDAFRLVRDKRGNAVALAEFADGKRAGGEAGEKDGTQWSEPPGLLRRTQFVRRADREPRPTLLQVHRSGRRREHSLKRLLGIASAPFHDRREHLALWKPLVL